MKPACWEACFLYPCPTVEHSNNCLLLLCRLFLKPSGHYTKIADTSGIANTANAKIELDGPIKTIAYGSDKNKWAFQQQFPDGVILSLGISETEIFYDYYDGKTWTRKWTR